jgi:hypothetical protein
MESKQLSGIRCQASAQGGNMISRIIAMIMLLVAVAGCDYLPFGYTEIKDVVQNPAVYDGKEIKIKGTVSNVTKIPFIEMKMYSLKDKGTEITVLTEGPLPAGNDKIAVRVLVSSIAIVGGESIGLKVKEIKRLKYVWQ